MRFLAGLCLGLVVLLVSCASPYHPLKDPDFRPSLETRGPGVKVTFLGNTNLLITDGETSLLVDGFFTRPPALQTLLGRIQPDREIIARELMRAGIQKLDGILVGHAHFDHALDTPEVARQTGNPHVMGSASYAMVHEGQGGLMDCRHLTVVTKDRHCRVFGDFTVTFDASDHVGAHSVFQRVIEGEIKKPVRVPAHYSRFKCGKVYAIHIRHKTHGAIAVTTTAGASQQQWVDMNATVVFLGVGLLSKEPCVRRQAYWERTVERLGARWVVPVHWDHFALPLSEGLQPAPRVADNVQATFDWVKHQARSPRRAVKVMGHGESLRLEHGQVK